MPSHTIQSVLVKLHSAGGAPWQWETWKEITSIRNGIFPSDDTLLPKGLTRKDVTDIRSYFAQYDAQPSEDAKIKFASGKATQIPGRTKWRDWITSGWRLWNIHSKISDVLTTEELHPLMIMANNSEDSSSWPQGELYIPLVVDAVALNLFGDESLDPSGRLKAQYRPLVQHIVQRTWINISKQTKRNKGRLETLEAAATKAFEGFVEPLPSFHPSIGVYATGMEYWASYLNSEKLSKKSLSAVIRAVSRWKTLAELFPTDATIDKIEKMEIELKRLMGGLGAKVEVEAATTPGLCKVNNHALSSLASEADVSDVITLYHDFFTSNQEGEANSFANEAQLSVTFGTAVKGADPGVEVESTLSREILASNLDFPKELPLLFNSFRHKGGFSPWTHPEAFKNSSGDDPDLEPLTLYWHQLAGVHAIIRMNFHRTKDASRCNGTLIADEVGLGKTFQAVTVILVLADLVIRQQQNIPLPPIIKSNPYLGRNLDETVPCYPHLIVVAGTLLSQWESELKTLIQPQFFDIFVYGSGKKLHEKFWSQQGPFHSSRHKKSNRIIIASYTALQQDFNAVFFSKSNDSKKLPWTLPKQLPHSGKTRPMTLYSERYLTITVDEAHTFRNNGPRHSSMLLLLNNAELRLIMTATPLQTSTKDIAAMGRLTGVPHFFSEEAHREEKGDAMNLRKARKEQVVDDDSDNENGNERDDDDPMKLCQYSIAQRMQGQFQGRVIRRTVESKDWQGQSLLKIPPYKSVHAILDLTERETALIAAKAEEVKDSVSSANSTSKFATRSFYIEYRLSVGYALKPDSPESEDASTFPTFKTLEQWEPLKSTKMDTCAKICRHMLTRDDVPPVIFENGQAIFPDPNVTTPPGGGKKEAKILIYQEFTSLRPLLCNILSLYGIPTLSIDGQTSFEKRDEIVHTFKTDPAARVLIFSSVGSTGLNLSCASVIIFMDQPWSAQDERQIRGRAHRQPQKKEVLVIHLLANNTADIVLSGMARGKHDMLEAFLSKQSNKDLCGLLSGKSLPIPVEDDDEGEESTKEGNPKKPGKLEDKKKHKRRKMSAIEPEDNPKGDVPPSAQAVDKNVLSHSEVYKAVEAAAASSGQPDGATTGDGGGLCGADRVASSLYTLSSNASMQSINPYGGGLNTSSNVSMHSMSSNASMGSMGPSGGRDASTSNVSLRSASSNASMRSMGLDFKLGYFNPPTTGSIKPSSGFSGADRDASTYASSNVSLRSASSNASMRSMGPDLGYFNPTATSSMHLNAAGYPPATSSMHLNDDAPKPKRGRVSLVAYSSPPTPGSSCADYDDEASQVMDLRDSHLVAPSPTPSTNPPKTPPPRALGDKQKASADTSFWSQRGFKNPNPLLPTPSLQKGTSVPISVPTKKLPAWNRVAKWRPGSSDKASGGSSSQSRQSNNDRERGSNLEHALRQPPSNVPLHRQPGSFLSPPPKDPRKAKNPFARKDKK